MTILEDYKRVAKTFHNTVVEFIPDCRLKRLALSIKNVRVGYDEVNYNKNVLIKAFSTNFSLDEVLLDNNLLDAQGRQKLQFFLARNRFQPFLSSSTIPQGLWPFILKAAKRERSNALVYHLL
jgi:hypothetical protein